MIVGNEDNLLNEVKFLAIFRFIRLLNSQSFSDVLTVIKYSDQYCVSVHFIIKAAEGILILFFFFIFTKIVITS